MGTPGPVPADGDAWASRSRSRGARGPPGATRAGVLWATPVGARASRGRPCRARSFFFFSRARCAGPSTPRAGVAFAGRPFSAVPPVRGHLPFGPGGTALPTSMPRAPSESQRPAGGMGPPLEASRRRSRGTLARGPARKRAGTWSLPPGGLVVRNGRQLGGSHPRSFPCLQPPSAAFARARARACAGMGRGRARRVGLALAGRALRAISPGQPLPPGASRGARSRGAPLVRGGGGGGGTYLPPPGRWSVQRSRGVRDRGPQTRPCQALGAFGSGHWSRGWEVRDPSGPGGGHRWNP